MTTTQPDDTNSFRSSVSENFSITTLNRSPQDLPKVLEKYKENADLLRGMYSELERRIEAMTEILQPRQGDDEEDNLLDHVDCSLLDQKMGSLGYRNNANTNPCIAVVGQTKSGKSTFLNTLLGEYIVPQSSQRCTARITHLFYSEENFVQLRHPESGIVADSYQKLTSATLPPHLPGLAEELRNNENESRLIVEAGIQSKFLAHGVDVVDSPGLNENASLDDLVKKMVSSAMPFIIYVIDGRRSLTESDLTDIRFIKENCADLQIVYFVTKLDASRRNPRAIDEIKEAEKRLNMVFKKLQSQGLIANEEIMEKSRIFHGASLWRVDDSRRGLISDKNNIHVKNFERMQQCLLEMVGGYLDYSILSTAETFASYAQQVLEKIITRAAHIYYDSQDKLNIISSIRKEEKQIYDDVINFLKKSESELKQKLLLILENQERLLEPLDEHQYSRQLGVPDIVQLSQQDALYEKCQREIANAVCQSLDTEIRRFTESELLCVYSEAEEYLINHIRKMAEMSVAKTSFRDMLERVLRNIYHVETKANHAAQARGVFSSISHALKVFKDRLFAFLAGRNTVTNKDVHDTNWKREQGVQFLQRLNKEDFVTKVVQTLNEDMTKKHNKFQDALAKETQCVNAKIKITEEKRKQLVELSPDFAVLYMKSWSISGSYKFENIKVIKKIGEGAQGQVLQVSNNGVHMAMKTSSVARDSMGDIGMEVYFSSTFGHRHLLPLSGVLIHNTEEEDLKKICLLMPMMKCDASHLLKKTRPPLLKRLKLALQVCDALVYLHTEVQVMHRDLKLANVLINENDEAVVADYGFCKIEALAMNSFVGTPVHIAPEIVRGREQYDKSVDVYSFGVLIWYFAEGNGRHPRYTRRCSSVATVLTAADEGARPERLEQINDKLWTLMSECWNNDPKKRPPIKAVYERFREIIENMS